MANTGFAEEKGADYIAPNDLVGQFRRLGPDGPAYEIIGLEEGGKVKIEIVHSGEKISHSVAEVLNDPMAETIP